MSGHTLKHDIDLLLRELLAIVRNIALRVGSFCLVIVESTATRKRTDLALSSTSNYPRLGMTAVAGPTLTHSRHQGVKRCRSSSFILIIETTVRGLQANTQQAMEKLPWEC